MFLLKETMPCMIGLVIGSHTVIPEALPLSWVAKSDGCRSCWRNVIENNLNNFQIEWDSMGCGVFSVLSTADIKLGVQYFSAGGLRWDCSWCAAVCRVLQELNVTVCQDDARAQLVFVCSQPHAGSQQGPRALCAVPLEDLTPGWIRGCQGWSHKVILTVACTALKFGAGLKLAFVEPKAFQTGLRKGLSYLSLFQVSFW